jgi:hypothetical protein
MMASSVDYVHAADDIGATLAAVSSSAAASGELMFASGTVIALRTAMGVRGLADPANANHAELARLVPEKSEAMSASSIILFQQATEATHRATLFALDEFSTAATASTEIATCGDPSALATLQGNLAMAAFGRVLAQSIAMGTLAMAAQQAAMAPFHLAATANAKRLTAAV